MIQRSIHQNYRAAALVCAVAVFSALSAASLQAQALTNLFGGAPSNAAATASSGLGGNIDSGVVALGAGFSGETTIPFGALATVSETVNANSNSSFILSATGVTLGATFQAGKSFANAGLLPSTQYAFTFTSVSTGSVNLFSSTGFTLSLNGTSFVDTRTNLGILGVANVLGVINGGGTTTFTFLTPANIAPGSTVDFAVQGNLSASVGLTPVTLMISGAGIAQVPEPGTVALAVVGMVGLAVWRTRRRLS